MNSALTLHHLTKTYRNTLHALRGIDLEVEEGDFFALLGPNGAGKSTAIGIIASLVVKSGGRVEIFGHDLDREPYRAKARLGLVPQEFNFNQFEPIEEILINQAGFHGIPRRQAAREAEQQLRRLGLWSKRGGIARQLSGGMKRRLMIARALVHHPSLLILDEPTAGVDVEIRRSMWEFLAELNQQGTTIILTTHYLEEAENLCRNLAIINNGEIVENGPIESLLQRLHCERYILTLDRPPSAPLQLSPFRILRQEGTLLELEIAPNQRLNDLFALLSAAEVCVNGIRSRQNRLERIMLEMAEQRHTPPSESPA